MASRLGFHDAEIYFHLVDSEDATHDTNCGKVLQKTVPELPESGNFLPQERILRYI